ARARLVSVQPALSLPSASRSAPGRVLEPLPTVRSRVQPVVRWALYAYICSIPFEMPGRSIPVEIPTLVGSVFLLATLLDRRAAYGRLPQALVAFVVCLWMFATAALLNLASHQLEVLHFFVEMVQLLLLFWTIANLLTDEPVRLGALRALALACAVRAALQVFGLASTQRALWTGGERISALGQNANLSALILATGLLPIRGDAQPAIRRGGDRESRGTGADLSGTARDDARATRHRLGARRKPVRARASPQGAGVHQARRPQSRVRVDDQHRHGGHDPVPHRTAHVPPVGLAGAAHHPRRAAVRHAAGDLDRHHERHVDRVQDPVAGTRARRRGRPRAGPRGGRRIIHVRPGSTVPRLRAGPR